MIFLYFQMNIIIYLMIRTNLERFEKGNFIQIVQEMNISYEIRFNGG